MKLNIAQKIALIYSGAGSQRATAKALGISHQKVGRYLRTALGVEGGYKSSAPLTDFFANQAVDVVFSAHKRAVKKTAIAQDIPYSSDVPIFSARMRHDDGIQGDRVSADHMHWISDDLRNKWITDIHKGGKYANISVGSIVNLTDYNRLATAVAAGKIDNTKLSSKIEILEILAYAAGLDIDEDGDTEGMDDKERGIFIASWLLNNEKKIQRAVSNKIIPQRIQTKYTEMGVPIQFVLADVNKKLNSKHAPATGDDGTVLADRVLLQIDTRGNKDAKFRKGNPYPSTKRSKKK